MKIKDILLSIDNQNPIYSSHITASEIRTKHYSVSKLNLLSKTKNDTIFFKSIFKGKNTKKEKF